jgi:hypothetical protein
MLVLLGTGQAASSEFVPHPTPAFSFCKTPQAQKLVASSEELVFACEAYVTSVETALHATAVSY